MPFISGHTGKKEFDWESLTPSLEFDPKPDSTGRPATTPTCFQATILVSAKAWCRHPWSQEHFSVACLYGPSKRDKESARVRPVLGFWTNKYTFFSIHRKVLTRLKGKSKGEGFKRVCFTERVLEESCGGDVLNKVSFPIIRQVPFKTGELCKIFCSDIGGFLFKISMTVYIEDLFWNRWIVVTDL